MNRPRLSLVLFWVAFFAVDPEIVFAGTVGIEAEAVHVDPERNIVLGDHLVRLDTPEILARSRAFILNLNDETLALYTFRAVLKTADLIIEGSELAYRNTTKTLRLNSARFHLEALPNADIRTEFATCRKGTCSLRGVVASTCPHRPRGYAVVAHEVTLHRSRDIDLKRITLHLDERPIFTVPWLRLRPRDKPGFTMPRLGYSPSGGLILGPGGYLPIGDTLHLKGYAAVRTYQGFETQSHLHWSHLELTLDHLFNSGGNHVRGRLDAALPLAHASWLNLGIDIFSRDRVIIEETAKSPLERAASHAASRGLLYGNLTHAVLETYVEYLEPFEGELPFGITLNPIVGVDLFFPSQPIVKLFWPSLNIGITRYGLLQENPSADAVGTHLTPSYSRTTVSPAVDAVGRLGVISGSLRAAYRHQAWLIESFGAQDSGVPHTHTIAVEAAAELPLYRDFATTRHLMTPFAKYRITPVLSGRPPTAVMDAFDRLQEGQGVELGTSTSLKNSETSFLSLKVFERFELPGFGEPRGASYLAAKGRIGPPQLNLNVDGAWDHKNQRPSILGVSVSSRTTHGRRFLEIGGRSIGPGNGPHRTHPFAIASSPWRFAPWPTEPLSSIEAFGDFKTPITRLIALVGGARVGVWPKKELHAVWYGLELSSRCGCLTAGLHASHRLNTAVPDVATSLSLSGL